MLKKETATTKNSQIKRKWILLDANGQVLGRLAGKIANLLSGKIKPYWVPYLDCGDFVVVVNSDKIVYTGNKLSQKMYYHHTGYPGGLRKISLTALLDKKPEEVLRHAVLGMLPKNKLRDQMIKRLKIYREKDHPYQDKFK